MLFDFGQPVDGIIQTAFVVEDVDASIAEFSSRLGVGPWTVIRGAGGGGARYRGEPSLSRAHLAFGFAGHMQFELVQPTDALPSVYRDVIEQRGYGFHHFGYAVSEFDEAVDAMLAQGYELALSHTNPAGRVAQFDTRDILPGFTELLEATDMLNSGLTAMYRASVGAENIAATTELVLP